MISIIAAIGRNRVLGKDNELLWRIPDDLKRFKELTLGHPIIMGRKTFESIIASLGKPLPGRTNIVVTRDPMWDLRSPTSVMRAGSIEEAIEKAKAALGGEKIFIGGGGQIYAEALPLVDKLYLTLIDDEKEGDSFFPFYESEFTNIVFEEFREYEGLKYRWVDLER
ncbi:MAG: dihydrofolate reductase [Minisyncoccia bacterium]